MCFLRPKLPHPEEPADYTRTLDNVDLEDVLNKWIVDWGVPGEYADYWKSAIVIKLTLEIYVPAQTWELDGVRHLDVRPEHCTPGVIAHEQSHNSYSLLTDAEKVNFASAYHAIKSTDKLIKLLYSINKYGLTSTVEGHAEIYRFLGRQMPPVLKKYYPKLF